MTNGCSVELSIVVACRNEIGHIRGFLDSLAGQELEGIGWEAVIADGLSEDGTRDALEEFGKAHSNVRIVSNPGRIVSTGLNAAIQEARGEIIIRMDAHTTYAPDYCRRSMELLRSTGADNVGGPARTVAKGAVARAVAAAYHSPFSTGGARFHNEDYEGWVDTVPYGCWRKATLQRIGLFDENLVRSQDDELNLRLSRAGGRIWQSPAVVSWYAPRSRFSGLFRQYFQYGFWKVAVIRKHRLPGAWRHLVPVAFVLGVAGLPAGAALAAAAGAAGWATLLSNIWLGCLAAYASANLAASAATASKRGWDILVYLPAVFATYHVSYGLGFLLGLFRFTGIGRPPLVQQESAYTRISR